MCNEEAFYNNEQLRKEAQKYLDCGECKTMEEAVETAWCEIEYKKWCDEQAMKLEDYDYGE